MSHPPSHPKVEFSRLFPVDRVPAEGCDETISAEPEELAGLARRFSIPAIGVLTARFTLKPWRKGGVKLTGTVEAHVTQTCVVSLTDFDSSVREELTRYFAGETAPGHAAQVLGVESLEDEDTDVISGGSIDLGEVAAETLGLALDPYPRKPGVVFAGGDGPEAADEAQPNPFAALKKLKPEG